LTEVLLALPFGLLVGVLLGLLGAGGSIVAVPVLVYVLQQTPQTAASESLLIVGAAAAIGSFAYARDGLIRLRVASVFAVSAVLGTLPGACVNGWLSSHALLLGLAALLLGAAAAILRTGPLRPSSRSQAMAASAGFAVGFLTGLFGVGGGFLVVPALVLIVGLPMQLAVGTSLAIIFITSTAALAAHLAIGEIDWGLSLVFVTAALLGTYGGTRLRHHVTPVALSRLLAAALIAVAAAIGTATCLQIVGA
jgi:uncharacterized membrane protein YfcA